MLEVPNPPEARKRTGQKYSIIDHEQTLTHIHHASELGITLPANFDVELYKSKNREERIQYAKDFLSIETITRYKYTLAKGLIDIGLPGTFISTGGEDGKFHELCEIRLQQINKREFKLSTIGRRDGIHRTSFVITAKKAKKLATDNPPFWVLRDQYI